MRLEVKEIFERVIELILFEENFLERIFVPKWQNLVKKRGWTDEYYLVNHTIVACTRPKCEHVLYFSHFRISKFQNSIMLTH
jgi:hypothetical protein